jgi:hypothetical protein
MGGREASVTPGPGRIAIGNEEGKHDHNGRVAAEAIAKAGKRDL